MLKTCTRVSPHTFCRGLGPSTPIRRSMGRNKKKLEDVAPSGPFGDPRLLELAKPWTNHWGEEIFKLLKFPDPTRHSAVDFIPGTNFCRRSSYD